MAPGAILDVELGDTARDRILLTNNGNVTLGGLLNVSVFDGFTPTLGQSFSLFEGAIGSITGAFDTIIAPVFNGLTFDVVQNAGSLLLQVGEASLVPGDFNGNGAVDAADYIVWRKDFSGDQTKYNAWRSNFGTSLGPGSGSALPSAQPLSAAVPEPATLLLFGFGLAVVLPTRRIVVCKPRRVLQIAAALPRSLPSPRVPRPTSFRVSTSIRPTPARVSIKARSSPHMAPASMRHPALTCSTAT